MREPSECAIEAAKNLASSINCMRDETNLEYIKNEMVNLHRTLNQSFTGNFIIPFIQIMAEKYENGYYDGRNESACKCCKIMAEALEKELGYKVNGLPFI